jgi:hypothetical protein
MGRERDRVTFPTNEPSKPDSVEDMGPVDLSSCEDRYQGSDNQRTQSISKSCDVDEPTGSFSTVVDMLATGETEDASFSRSRPMETSLCDRDSSAVSRTTIDWVEMGEQRGDSERACETWWLQ